ncbi:MAG TPA: hypothetical protein VJY62_14430 [Bacteroidia bacterium]|nr:hypothetical protein [Bacteroidia bacterium]
MIKLSHLAETTQSYQPGFAALSYATKPYTDGILAFRETLVAEMQKQGDNFHSKEESEILMANLEKKFSTLYKDFDVCRNNLDNSLSDFEEMKKLYAEIEG